MSTTLETAHTVAAVLSVFHNAADLMKQIIKRSKKKKSEHALRLKWLLETLESGELQISKKYAEYLQELGERFKLGDSTARDRLQHVAIIMQAELLRCLQLALDYEHAELDITKIQDDASFFRRDVLSALDELRTRLLEQAPAQPPPLFTQIVPTLHRGSTSGPSSPGIPSPGSIPAGVTVHEMAADEHHGRMSRFFSISRKSHKQAPTSSSTIQNMIVAPELSWLGPVQAEPVKYELPAEDVYRREEPSSPYPDVKPAIPEPGTEYLHPALQQRSNISRHASTSTHSSGYSNYTRSSVFSDEKIAVVEEGDESTFPNMGDMTGTLPSSLSPAPLQIRARQSQISTSSVGSHLGPSHMSPTGTSYSTSPIGSPTDMMPAHSTHSYWYPQTPAHGPAMNLPIPVPTRDRSNTTSSVGTSASHHQQRNSVVRPPSLSSVPSSSSHTTAVLVGRPEKKNNYWGFCKGAWTIREEWRKGLVMQVIQSGMFAQKQVWQCKHCSYQGGIFGANKPYHVDPNVHENAETGVRYRWIFLAKSHTKVKIVAREGEGGFGCLVCSLENVPSGVYSTETMLFKHIMDDHAPGMTDSLATRAKCIIGRRAAANEQFDINIP